MQKKRLTSKKIESLVEEIVETYRGDSGINFIDASNLPVRAEILEILELLFEVLFPGHARTPEGISQETRVQKSVGRMRP